MARRLTSLFAGGLLCALAVVEGSSRADGLADPMRPAGAKASSTGTRVARAAPVVSAILVANGRRVAIVDGRAVQAGERIGDTRIDAILDNGVRYTRAGVSATSELPVTAAKVRDPSSAQVRFGDSKQ